MYLRQGSIPLTIGLGWAASMMRVIGSRALLTCPTGFESTNTHGASDFCNITTAERAVNCLIQLCVQVCCQV